MEFPVGSLFTVGTDQRVVLTADDTAVYLSTYDNNGIVDDDAVRCPYTNIHRTECVYNGAVLVHKDQHRVWKLPPGLPGAFLTTGAFLTHAYPVTGGVIAVPCMFLRALYHGDDVLALTDDDKQGTLYLRRHSLSVVGSVGVSVAIRDATLSVDAVSPWHPANAGVMPTFKSNTDSPDVVRAFNATVAALRLAQYTAPLLQRLKIYENFEQAKRCQEGLLQALLFEIQKIDVEVQRYGSVVGVQPPNWPRVYCGADSNELLSVPLAAWLENTHDVAELTQDTFVTLTSRLIGARAQLAPDSVGGWKWPSAPWPTENPLLYDDRTAAVSLDGSLRDPPAIAPLWNKPYFAHVCCQQSFGADVIIPMSQRLDGAPLSRADACAAAQCYDPDSGWLDAIECGGWGTVYGVSWRASGPRHCGMCSQSKAAVANASCCDLMVCEDCHAWQKDVVSVSD